MNPFNVALDRALRGKRVHVTAQNADGYYQGWVERIHHQRGSILLHDAQWRKDERNVEDVGSVFIRNPSTVHVIDARKKIVRVPVEDILESPYLDDHDDYEIADVHMRSAYRNQFTKGFPVVRPVEGGYELLNGHKRIAACRVVGLDSHPVEVFDCTDEQARELVALAHRDELDDEAEEDEDGGDNA